MPMSREEMVRTLTEKFSVPPEALEPGYKRPRTNNGLRSIQFKLPDDVYQALRRDAKRQGRSMAGLVKHILAHRYLIDENP
jgi:hypothetical protein